MQITKIVVAGFFFCGAFAGACRAQEKDHGKWKSPFDGKTLAGWKQFVGTAPFTVEEGSIVGRTKVGSPSSYLCTETEYADFELEFEVKCDTGLNSGCQLRTRQIKADDVPADKQKMVGRIFGPQVEIESSPGQAGFLYGQGMGGWLSPEPKGKNESAKSHSHFRNDEWNRIRVIAKGPRIQTFVNGNKVADLTHPQSYGTHPKGTIGLQVHMVGRKQGPFTVAWRNIRIHTLKTSAEEPKGTTQKWKD
jgi:hypothetical protein